MTPEKPIPLVIHGWKAFAHPLFLTQLEVLVQQVTSYKQQDPIGYVKKNATKRLAAIVKLAFELIPQDPTRADYRQGDSLGTSFNLKTAVGHVRMGRHGDVLGRRDNAAGYCPQGGATPPARPRMAQSGV